MKKQTQTFPYNLKKVLAGVMLVAIPVFTSCEKDPTEPNRGGGNNNNPTQKHNVELMYGKSQSTQWQNISMDTINKYNSDQTVDTIFMIPEQTDQFATLSATPLNNVIVPELRKRHNVNPKKVFGKGDLVLNSMVTTENPEIVSFFQDTLKYKVINPSKNR